MKSNITRNMPASSNKSSLTQSLFSGFVKTTWIVPAAAAFIVLLFLVVGQIHPSQVGRHFVFALVYSASIGIPSAVLLTWVSFRYTEKLPRLIILVQFLLLLGTATVGCFVAGAFFQFAGILPPREFWDEFRGSFPFSIVITLMIGMSISTFETMRYKLHEAALKLRTNQVEQERANKLLAEARLSSLESRIHPHFLFNTLNSIASLIPSDPRQAEDTVGKLASLLRFSLNANYSGLVPLSQELTIVRDYLEIEKTRFGPRLNYEIIVPEGLKDAKVPPLALQSLVENSMKHVVSQRARGANIQVTGSMTSGAVVLRVIDDGPGFSLGAIAPEHGLGNLISRLELLFGDAGQLAVHCADGKTTVSLSFPA